MLKPNEAAKQLQQWRLNVDEEEPLRHLEPKLNKLPKKFWLIACGLFNCNEQGEQDWEDETDRFGEEQLAAFAKLSKADRTKLLRALFGDLATDMEVTLNWLAKPLQSHGHFAPPFRGPVRQELLHKRQSEFVRSLSDLSCYDPSQLSITWLAAWAPHLSDWGQYDRELGQLFAATIDQGGHRSAEVLEILMQSARKEHPIGGMGDHVLHGLLFASKREGWEQVGRLLLAAKRQEGLRQSVLQSAIIGHPDAFAYILQLILEHDLTRYSSVVSEFDNWLGMAWGSKATKPVRDALETLSGCLSDPANIQKSLGGDDPERAYLALWALALRDTTASAKAAARLAEHRQPEFRFVAAKHLNHLPLPAADEVLIQLLDDDDLRVAWQASNWAEASPYSAYFDDEQDEAKSPALMKKWFAAFERFVERAPVKQKLQPIVWPWTGCNCERKLAAWQLIRYGRDSSPVKLLPHLASFDKSARSEVANLIVSQKKLDAPSRAATFQFAGDAAADVRDEALSAIAKLTVTTSEAQQLESYLTRSTADLRTRIVAILLAQPDQGALASVERLLAQSDKNQRLAGLELLRQLAEAGREHERCLKLAKEFSQRPKLLKDEQRQLDAIHASGSAQISLQNCLGLMELGGCTPVKPPRRKAVKAVTAATPKLIKALDDFVHERRKLSITYKRYSTEQTELLGEISYGFPTPDDNKPLEPQLAELPLREELEAWHEKLPAACKDTDGMHLLRANCYYSNAIDWNKDELRRWGKPKDHQPLYKYLVGDAKPPKLRYENLVEALLNWLVRIHLPDNALEFALDVAETAMAMVPSSAMQSVVDAEDYDREKDWREINSVDSWRRFAHEICRFPEASTDQRHIARQFHLARWIDCPVPGARRDRVGIRMLADAYRIGEASLCDIYDEVIGPRTPDSWGDIDFSSLRQLTQRAVAKPLRDFVERPEIRKALNDIVDKLLEIELARGEAATVTSKAAMAVSAYRGSDALLKLLAAIGPKGFKRNTSWRSDTENNRIATFTEMASQTFPDENDTPPKFAKRIKAAIQAGQFPEERLLQLAFLAPQWTEQIEAALGWPGFAEGLYWFMAHMKYVHGMDEAIESDEALEQEEDALEFDLDDAPERLSRWERMIRERTPLTESERADGAIDTAWFRRTYAQLTPQRWQAMAEAARFGATSAQAKRAQLVADVLLGTASKRELVEGIKKRNLKENVRLLGLLPLTDKKTQVETDIHERYETLQGYLKYANQLSSMSRPEALRAYEIGMQNLASIAGYADPMRLQWALEAATTRDLAAGPVIAKKGDVTMSLSLDDRAAPRLEIRRGDKALKSLPTNVKKERAFADLQSRHQHLKKQASRIKQSLETAMCRGDAFTGAELAQLHEHAILWPQLQRVVLIGEGITGYPDKSGKALRDFAGKLEPVKKGEQLRIAHPVDLLESKQWSNWQHDCFAAERLQPFKQLFRELYVITAQEKRDKTCSRRYAGQQVNPRQAFALWGRRGWSVDEYENVWKAFHAESLQVSVAFNRGYTTPLAVEGLTVDEISFHARGDYRPLKLTEVPKRLFSEVMRDMDLVVSVAHIGDVDPEATASTVEMRAALLNETCQLLKLKNVKLKGDRAVIRGELGEYTVHLGSGVVHRMPGGAVCLVPVHSQHRGRLFLPFADDDPRTAEVISKTLMLARDAEIDDPILLRQITGKE